MTNAVHPARPSRPTTISITAAALVFAALGSGEARADTSSAVALFHEAKSLMSQKRYAEACPKLAQSQRLDPSGGTILHLALCHKEEGRTATAYKELQDAVLFAQRDQREDREKAAKALIVELLPKLPKLTITVSQEAAQIAGLEVKRDGAIVPATEWGAPAAVDPGSHTVTAWAPGRKPFSTAVDLHGDGALGSLSIPTLEVDPTGRRPENNAPGAGGISGPANGGSVWTGQRKAGVIIGGLGLASVVVGSVFGIQAASAKSDSEAHCKVNICDDEGIKIRQSGITSGNVSTVAFIAGGTALVGGFVLYLTGAPSQRPKKEAAGVTSLSVGPAWASVRGQF